MIGPWGHGYGHDQPPGPNIGFLQESLRWWDHWLKGADTGVMEDPMLTMWMPEAVPPKIHYTERPGRWFSEASWPTPNVDSRVFFLSDHTLDEEPQPEGRIDHLGVQTAGRDGGEWASFGYLPDWPPDQRNDDGLSISLTSAPSIERLEILGSPLAKLSVAADRPAALISVRLCDVGPTGESTLITRRMLNLTHRDSDEHPKPLEPGKRYDVTVPLGAIAYAVPSGHRLRLAVSPTYWPFAWPSPEPVTLSLFTGESSRLELPVRSTRVQELDVPNFDEPEAGPPFEVEAGAWFLLQGAPSRRPYRQAGVHVLRRDGPRPARPQRKRIGRLQRLEVLHNGGGPSICLCRVQQIEVHRQRRLADHSPDPVNVDLRSHPLPPDQRA